MKEKTSISKTTISAIIIYGLLSIAALSDYKFIHIIGIVSLFITVFSFSINESIKLVVIFTPNLAVVRPANDEIQLMGMVYLILLIKLIIKDNYRVKMSLSIIIPFIYLLLLSIMRIINGNYYDFTIIFEVFFVILTWHNYFYNKREIIYKDIYESYSFGCILMIVGMILRRLMLDTSTTRYMALLDNPNYTSMVFVILFASSLIAISYKLDVAKPVINIIISLIGGGLTGSRGFLLSLSVVVFLFVISMKGRERRTIYSLFIAIGVFVLAMFFLDVRYVVEFYNNTIGRTIDLKNSYHDGAFMDVTSGRMYLWSYYINNYICNSAWILLFGRGFYNYYLVSNGGYHNMAAHNSYIASVIGIGLIGTFMLFKAYFSIWQGILFHDYRRKCAFYSIFLGTAIGYFFLDGILDLRYILSIVIMLAIYRLYCLGKPGI